MAEAVKKCRLTPNFPGFYKGLDNAGSPDANQIDSLRKTMETYNVAAKANVNAPMQIIDMHTWQPKIYRYSGEYDINNSIVNGSYDSFTGKGLLKARDDPGHFSTRQGHYATVYTAKQKCQLPETFSYNGRMVIDTKDVKDNIFFAFSKNDTEKHLFEFTAKDNPGWGSGGASQFLIKSKTVPFQYQKFGDF